MRHGPKRRIRLKPRARYDFHFDIPVRVTDINYGGHLGNDRLLSLLHEARSAFLASHGMTEQDCAGVSLTMGDAVIQYRAEAFAGDVLRIEVAAGEPAECGFRLFYRVTRPADGAEVALAETGMAACDYTARRVRPLPDGMAVLFQAAALADE